jgi:exosortase A
MPHAAPMLTSRPPGRHWRGYLALLIAALVVLVLIYRETAWSLVALWQSSETYAHGFMIYPVSLYLIWRERVYLGSITPRPNVPALAAFAALGLGWMVAQSAGVQVVAQYMFVAMIPALTAAILGLRVARAIAFPLAFTLLAVPFGEIFILPLINFTADFTVLALQLTGIPVFREGNHFTIPSGRWSVVEACSGLRYLIASFTLGCLYAYLTYRSRLRQLVFIVLSIIVPIIANGLRAYLIVLLGHLSDMQIAVGVDHLIYGWLFFGLVMLVLFWAGSFWREDGRAAAKRKAAASNGLARIAVVPLRRTAAIGVAALAIAWAPHAYLHLLERQTFNPTPAALALPQAIGPWTAASPVAKLTPSSPGAASTVMQEYRNGDRVVGIYIAFFRNQHQGAEAVSSRNLLVNEHTRDWRVTGESMRNLELANAPGSVRQSRLLRGTRYLLAWQWYWLGDAQTANAFRAKWLQAKQRLLGTGNDGANIVVFAPYDTQPAQAVATMESFLAAAAPTIRQSLQQAGEHR